MYTGVEEKQVKVEVRFRLFVVSQIGIIQINNPRRSNAEQDNCSRSVLHSNESQVPLKQAKKEERV
jgi:hypothetical protein